MNSAILRKNAEAIWKDILYPSVPQIFIGQATCGEAAGANETAQAIKAALQHFDIRAEIHPTGCLGLCYREPLVDIIKPGFPRITFQGVTAEKASILVETFLVEGIVPDNLVLGAWEKGKLDITYLYDVPMLKNQVRLALRNAGCIDPTNISHYVARGGYIGLENALDSTSTEIISEIESSGLRGRGGAGFPTYLKWKLCYQAEGNEKYVICNADEGDPGAFMNRALLESDPHAVLEGITIGAYAIGASLGFIYIRIEYPLAIQRLRTAIEQARSLNLLGKNILGSNFDFDLVIKEGAGAFVCGEETALIASIEGYRGTPRPRPPFPVEAGLWQKPTVINNVETWSHVSYILKEGADKFNCYGTEKSKGTKTFSLAGKVRRTGLIEVPLGTTLQEIAIDIGGGVEPGKDIKAVQIGGPSGGCLPASMLDRPVDYEELAKAGAIMGSGGIVILDNEDCLVDTARYFLSFTESESCGKCSPCRIGTRQLSIILDRITTGSGQSEDMQLLQEQCQTVKSASLCGLGQGAPNPVLTTIKHFGEEFTSHIEGKRCPALVCRGLINYTIMPEKCRECGLCQKNCPTDAISGGTGRSYAIDSAKCNRCGNCLAVCSVRFGAVQRSSG